MVGIIELLLSDYLYHVVFVLLILLFLLGWKIRRSSKSRLKQDYKVDGKEAYSDLSGTQTSEIIESPILYSSQLGLSGKPDKVMMKGDKAVVWEYKSSDAPKEPYMSHKLQVACYAMLIEEEKGISVKEGIVKYSDGEAFEIRITERLKKKVLRKLDRMRNLKRGATPRKNHNSQGKCTACIYRDICKNNY